MSTVTQTHTQSHTHPVSPTRKLFPHLAPPKAVVNIISSKRRASSTDLKSDSTSSPKQRRTVSTPLIRDKGKSSSDVDAERRQQASQSVPDGPQSSASVRQNLTFPHIAKLFVKLRRMQKRAKSHHTDSASGDAPISHESLTDSNSEPDVTRKLARLEILEVYACLNGVDVAKLLRASRTSLLEHASPLHANVLVDEQWTSSICRLRHRSNESFRVHIRYTATAATSSKRDPQQPVAVDKISGVPGLMTITQRDTVGLNVVELYEDAQVIHG